MAKIDKMCQKSAFLVIPSQNHWKWPTFTTIVQAPWSKKSYFSDFSSNIEVPILAMKGPQMWQKSLITWKYDGKTPLEKKLGQFRSPGAEIWLFKKKIWTVPLILQFNIWLILVWAMPERKQFFLSLSEEVFHNCNNCQVSNKSYFLSRNLFSAQNIII